MASSKKAIYAAILGNFAIAVTKFLGAAVSGSSAMLAEGIHSLVDTGNGGLLLLGIRRSQRPPDDTHPYGYGKALYFYTLVVAILIFGLGGGFSFYEGLLHTLDPGHGATGSATIFGVTIGGLMLNTIVLSAAIVFEALAFRTAWNEFNLQRGNTNFWDAVRTSKDPTTVTVLFEDSAAMAGLIVALVGVHLAHLLEMPILDGIASMAIGLILFSVAAFLAWESKKLLVGEAAHPDVQASVRAIANEQSGVAGLGRVLTLHMGPYNLVLNMEVNFEADRTTADISRTIDALEDAVRTAHPEIKYIFVEAGSLAGKRRGTNASSEQNA